MILESILEDIIVGFSIYTILILITKPFLKSSIKLKIFQFDNSACQLVVVSSLMYLLVWSANLIIQFNNLEIHIDQGQIHNRISNNFWMVFLIQLFLILPSQILWFKNFRTVNWIRLVIALFLLTSVESVIIYLTSLNREYLTSSWSIQISAKLVEWFISLGLFCIIAIPFHLLKNKIKGFKIL